MRIKVADGRGAVWIEFVEDTQVDVSRALHAVKMEKPEILQRWCDEEGQLRGNLDVFLNGENIRYQEGLTTQLRDGDEVYVIAHIAGG
ncbi:MAG: MoaD/ThiS family protein [Anaerolineales bacterium]|nr:MoaD/ThiS family protein [Anaerolineales bacterium]